MISDTRRISQWTSARPPAAGPGVDLVVEVAGVHVGPGVAVVRVAAAHVHHVARRQVHARLRGKYFYQLVNFDIDISMEKNVVCLTISGTRSISTAAE